MDTIKEVLMERDGMTAAEADDLIEEAAQTLAEYLQVGEFAAADNICQEYFSLEPDYVMDLL